MKPILFLHIPRTGGMAYRAQLRPAFRGSEIREDRTAGNKTLPQLHNEFVYNSQHKFITGHWDWSIVEKIPEVRVITILRDPIQRAISDFNHHLREPLENAWNTDVFGITDFFKFIDTDQGYARMFSSQTRQLSGYTWGRADPNFSVPTDLDVAKNNIDKCFWVNFTESPQRMLPTRNNGTLLWKEQPAGHKVNITPSNVTPLDDKVIRCIMDMNRYDMKLYKYALRRFQ